MTPIEFSLNAKLAELVASVRRNTDTSHIAGSCASFADSVSAFFAAVVCVRAGAAAVGTRSGATKS